MFVQVAERLGYKAFFIWITDPPVQSWPYSDCRREEQPSRIRSSTVLSKLVKQRRTIRCQPTCSPPRNCYTRHLRQ
jgi:hypothetical protein